MIGGDEHDKERIFVGEVPRPGRRFRVLRHRALRWFQPPIRDVVRGRVTAPVNRSQSRDN